MIGVNKSILLYFIQQTYNSNKTRNLTRMLEDLQANATKVKIKVNHHLDNLNTETTSIYYSCKAGQANVESMVNELD